MLNPEHTAEASVIFLHGLGADGHDLEPIIKELDLPDDLQIRYIFPHAPKRPITINGGEEMRAWYDFIPHSESEGSEDIKASSNSIYEFIRREMNLWNLIAKNSAGRILPGWRYRTICGIAI